LAFAFLGSTPNTDLLPLSGDDDSADDTANDDGDSLGIWSKVVVVLEVGQSYRTSQ
jgi:hypothetical protein